MKKFFIISFILLFFSLSFCYYFYLPISDIPNNRSFVINQGDSLKTISLRLYNNKFTKNEYSFFIYAFLTNSSKNIKAGGFQLTASDNLSEILFKLTTGGSHDFWLTVIPGQRIEEISSKFAFTPDMEGYLLPDSYLIPEYFTLEETVNLIKENFDTKLAPLNINSNNLSKVITIASLLEREAKTIADRQMVAGIINNRLKINMAVQIDATIQYARDTKNKPAKYWLQLSKNDLKLKSPFNTYINTGLPPSPICNPSYDSIYAAVNPTPSEYLYYIHSTNGKMYFAKTLTEHNSNIAKYLK